MATSDDDYGLKAELHLSERARALSKEIADERDQAAGEQLGLFGQASVFGTLRTPEGRAVPTGGRPKGAKNRSTRELARLIQQTGRDPVLAMAEIVATPIDVIASTLGCKRLEAAEYQRKVMSDLAGYVHQKLPTAVQLQGATAGMLVINIGGHGSAAASGLDMKVINADPHIEENQGLSGDDAGQSHKEMSHSDDKSLIEKDN